MFFYNLIYFIQIIFHWLTNMSSKGYANKAEEKEKFENLMRKYRIIFSTIYFKVFKFNYAMNLPTSFMKYVR